MVSSTSLPKPRSCSSRTAFGCRLMPTPSGCSCATDSNTMQGTPIWCSVRAVAMPPMPPPAMSTGRDGLLCEAAADMPGLSMQWLRADVPSAARAWRKQCMMTIMRNTNSSARASAKEATHERIVSVAARAIRRSGYGGTGVADIMKEAGLTHGAFYAHFASRDAMLAEAANRACAESAAAAAGVGARVAPRQALASMLCSYLSREHLGHAETAGPLRRPAS